jgi:predicted Zn-dependent protease
MTTPLRTICSLAALAFAATLASTGCAPNRAPSASFIKQADELHAQALAATVTPDDDLNDYVQQIGTRLENAAQEIVPDKSRGPFFQSMRFYVVDSPVINVFTTGGAHVYVYRGLFDFCNTEDELAAAMAHAYAHALNLDTEATGINPPKEIRPLRAIVWDYVVNRFNAQHEEESDKLAFRLYARAGWDPSRFEVLFSRLSDEYPGPAAPDRQDLAARGALVRGLTAAGVPRQWRQLPVADARTFDVLRKHATSLRFASSASNDARLYLLAFPNCILSQDLPEQRQAQDRLRPPPPPEVQLEPN